ncbi:MAG TPA: hypothetical protein VHF06_37845 [Pseudonocardiaceae bacterium]|nr:hypothetical protein [Pseudonocardiaceae bacterium]
MDLSVTADEFVAAFQRDFPQQFEITALRLVNQMQSRRIAELEAERDIHQHGHDHGEDG